MAHVRTIHKDGDLVLHVQDGEEEDRFLVLSIMLTNASPVFKALIDGRFKEGLQTSHTDSAREIAVQDSLDVMEILLLLLHNVKKYSHRSTGPPYFAGHVQRFELAVLADKYDVLDFISDKIYIQMKPLKATSKTSSSKIAAYNIATSIICRFDDIFAKYTRHLILHTVERLEPLFKDLFDIVTYQMLYDIECERSAGLNFIRSRASLMVSGYNCSDCSEALETVDDALSRTSTYATIHELQEVIRSVSDYSTMRDGDLHCHICECPHLAPEHAYSKEMRVFIQNLGVKLSKYTGSVVKQESVASPEADSSQTMQD